jgi:hypothetical protein
MAKKKTNTTVALRGGDPDAKKRSALAVVLTPSLAEPRQNGSTCSRMEEETTTTAVDHAPTCPVKVTTTTAVPQDPTLAEPRLGHRLAPRSACGELDCGAIPDRAGFYRYVDPVLAPPDGSAAGRIAGLDRATINLVLAETRAAADLVARCRPMGTRLCWAEIVGWMPTFSRWRGLPSGPKAATDLEPGDVRAILWLSRISPCADLIVLAAGMIAAGVKPPDDPGNLDDEGYLPSRSPWHRLAFAAEVRNQAIAKLRHGRVTPEDLRRYVEYEVIDSSRRHWHLEPGVEREYRDLAMHIMEAVLADTAARS